MGVAGKEADWDPPNGSSYPLDCYNPSLLKSPFGKHSHRTQIASHFFVYSKRFIHIPLPQTSLSPNFQSHPFYFQFYDCSAKPLGTVHELLYNHVWPVLLPSKMTNQVDCSQVLPTGRVSLHHCPLTVSQKGVIALQLFASGVLLTYTS